MEVSEINRDTTSEIGQVPTDTEADYAAIATLIRSVAERGQGDGVALLRLLRLVEALHQEIREELFQEALPSNRQALYALLKDMESEGGWPYINRMRLQSILARLLDVEGCSPAKTSEPAESIE
jgi:hypothetical protein